MGFADSEFIGFRAEQLAVLALTSRNDVVVRAGAGVGGRGYGIDLTISILSGGREVGRLFGVQIKGVVLDEELTDPEAQSDVALDMSKMADFPFPVCLIAYAMVGDRGYWDWLREPTIGVGSFLKTNSSRLLALKPFTAEAVDQIVESVNHWYDRQSVSIAA